MVEDAYRMYMLGADVLSKDPSYKITPSEQSAMGETTGAMFHTYTKGLFKSDTGFNKGLKDATEKAYAYLSSSAGVQAGELDGDLYRQAMSTIVGDVVDYGGEPLLLPRGWDMEKLDDAVTTITMEDVERMGGFQKAPVMPANEEAGVSYTEGSAGSIMQQASQTSKPATSSTFVSPERMILKFKSGDVRLQQGSDFGQYLVYAGNRLIRNAEGGPFHPQCNREITCFCITLKNLLNLKAIRSRVMLDGLTLLAHRLTPLRWKI